MVTCASAWQAEARVAEWKRGFLQPCPETCAGTTLTCASAWQAEARVTPNQQVEKEIVSCRHCNVVHLIESETTHFLVLLLWSAMRFLCRTLQLTSSLLPAMLST